jgi:crotonobetainyl-CoA:carnitine CoA-transferase CaiB-like acyl-CoA transferase
MAMSGLLDLIRDSAGNPIAPNVPLAGLSGSLFAALGILLALLSRERAGAGQHLDVALSDSLVSMLAMPMAFALSGSALPGRPQGKPQVSFPCYRMYRTRDGRHISVGPLEGHLWKELCRKLGCPEYEEFQYDEARTEEIAAHLSALFESRNRDEWIAELNSPDDCVAPVNLIGEVAGEPHFRDRGVIDIPDVGVPQPAVLPRLSGTPGEIRLPPYRFGQHTREILQEHGYSDGQIAAMTASGAAWEPPAPANGTAEG